MESNIEMLKSVTSLLKLRNIELHRSWIIDEYPYTNTRLSDKIKNLSEGTERLVKEVDFAIADYSENSRTVFYQTIIALENKLPVLCLVSEDKKELFPDSVLKVDKELVTVRYYKKKNEIENIVLEFLEEVDPPKRRFNIVLDVKTLKMFEYLANKNRISKAEQMRRLISSEYLIENDE